MGNANLLRKVYFPRLIIPVASVLGGLVDFALAFGVLLGIMAFSGIRPDAIRLLWLPLLLALLADVIDELGGLDVDIQTPTSEFPAGVWHMDGETTVLYVRQRLEDTDFHRSQRQNEVLLALRQEVTKPSVLPHVPDLIDAFIDRTLTDLSRSQLAMFTCLLNTLDEDHIDTHAITPEMTTSTFTDNGSFVLLPDYDAISALLQEFLSNNHPMDGG